MANVSRTKYASVDEYLSHFDGLVLERLIEIRAIIKATLPEAEEVISYNMPGYRQNSMLVWFAGYKNHIGFYPSARPIEVFSDELTKYKTSKGAIQFPLGESVPGDLINRIIAYRIQQLTAEQAKVSKKK